MSQTENDDDSFIIILGSSPGSLEGKSNGGVLEVPSGSIEAPILDDVIKDLPEQANKAFKAQFNLGDSPSPASMMVASTLITDDRSTEELQKRFGEILDENVVLKETLKQNNDSLKEQFSLIASCQDDMLQTHKLHKEKFDETRALVEKLRLQNRKLKEEIVLITKTKEMSLTNGVKSGPSSGVEFVTSPDDDTINKLTAQLELVEKQRRQVIVDNEKLTWQRESLEHIVNATSKERDDLKAKLNTTELLLSSKENNHTEELKQLHGTIEELQKKMKLMSMNVHSNEIQKRDEVIHILEGKVSSLLNDLKKAQITILDLENIKLEFAKYKGGVSDMVKTYKEQIVELNARIKSCQTMVFQPVHMTMTCEGEASPHYGGYLANVKLYDRTLKHIAEYLNNLTNGLSDDLVRTMGVISSIQDVTLERASIEKVRAGLIDVKQAISKHHNTVLQNIAQLKGSFTIFEGIFKDYNELLKKTLTKREETPAVEQLTAALVARGEEVQSLENEIVMLVSHKEDCELLRAQVELYKSDFEAERKSREEMVTEKEKIATDLRVLQKKHAEIVSQLEEVRKMSPSVFKTASARISANTAKISTPLGSVAANTATVSAISGSNEGVTRKKKIKKEEKNGVHETTPPAIRYDCPVCDKPFKTLILLQQHVDSCLL
ncbi:optineurin isoform X1 [Pieris brassicae]|uniref:optineurin isoform X1 n=1 Tax=Pieris brassicae TaxID=7116 RepID=UPI001E6623E2|nr:optineurin isoform X1 [Pieris brassicae]XP_045527590.1 optineurin isoform X1 [Pieris brassicae]